MNKIITFMKTIIIALAIVISGLQAWAGGPAASVPVTGTLPVVYVNTKDNAPVVNKDDEIEATLYIDPCGADDVEPLARPRVPWLSPCRDAAIHHGPISTRNRTR